MNLKVYREMPEDENSQPPQRSQPKSNQSSPQSEQKPKRKPAGVPRPETGAKASKPSKSDQTQEGKLTKKKKVKPRNYFLVIATLGKVPRCEVCSTTDEVRQHLQKELHSSVASDIHAWLFHGHKLKIPTVGEYDLDLSFTDAAGQKLKIFDSSADKTDDISGLLIRPGEGNLVSESDLDSDDDSMDDDDFMF